MAGQSVICIVSCIMAYIISCNAQFLPDLSSLECSDEAEPLDDGSISLAPTVSQNGDGTWSLRYSITWDPQPCICAKTLYIVTLLFEDQDTPLEPWNFTDCNEALDAAESYSDLQILENPSFEADAPFSYQGLFRIIYGQLQFGSPIPVSPASNIPFQTPDCFEATNDTEFCSSQDVYRTSPPRGVILIDATDTYGTVKLRFSWQPPVQVNKTAVLWEYSAEVVRPMDETQVLAETVPANQGSADSNEVIWEAFFTDGGIVEGQNYTLLVVPYVSFDSENPDPLPGWFVEYHFTAGPVRYLTTQAAQSMDDGEESTSPSSFSDSVVNGPSTTLLIVVIIVVFVILSVIFSVVICVILSLVRRRSVAADDVGMEQI